MDRGHGATFAGGTNMQECWDEYQKMIEETKLLDDYLDEECGPRSYDGTHVRICYSNMLIHCYSILQLQSQNSAVFLDHIFCFIVYTEGEEEAEWLRNAGLGELTEPWKAGREIQQDELNAAIRPYSRAQAEAVRRRVRSLNHTVKQRFGQKQRVRKPIKDVFKDVEVRLISHLLFFAHFNNSILFIKVSSTGTRSRSATPDSLDSVPGETLENVLPPSPPRVIDTHQGQ